MMSWKKIPAEAPEGFSTQAVLMTAPGEGFSASKRVDFDKLLADKDLKKRDAEDPAYIFRIRADWKDVEKVFETTGVFEGFYRTGPNRALALNRTYEEDGEKEVYRCYGFEKGRWSRISSLEQNAIKVLGSDSSWLLAMGYSGSPDLPFSAFSRDGGHSWNLLARLGVDFMGDRNLPLWLDSAGRLYHAFPSYLSRRQLEDSTLPSDWKKIQDFPPSFKPILIAGADGNVHVLGQTGPEMRSLWTWNETSQVRNMPCQGLPKGFNPSHLAVGKSGFHLVGNIAQFANGEMKGFKNYIYRSTDGGSTWVNMDAPITGSLEAYDFGEDGSIWALAAGNRLQVYGP